MNAKPRYVELSAVPLSLLSGLLLALSLPPQDFNSFGWIGFLPLLLACRLVHPIPAAGCGMLTAFACGAVLAGGWSTPQEFANLFAAFGGLALVVGLVAGFASYGSMRINSALWPFFVASAGVTAELLSVYFFPVNVAVSQHQNPVALRIASYTGVWGVSFLIWLLPASVLTACVKPKSALPALVVCVPVLALTTFCAFPVDRSSEPTLAVAAVQAMDPYDAAEETDRIAPRAHVVVWPEQLTDWNNTKAYEAATKNGRFIVASFRGENIHPKPYNTARLISPTGETLILSQKRHLFGVERSEYRAGRRSLVADCGWGVAICYDTMFTDVVRDLTRQGARIILMPNSDPESPKSLLGHLHGAITSFRAAENGVPIVLADRTALSAIYDGSGRKLAQVPKAPVTSVCGKVNLRRGMTLFTIVGDDFAYLCAAFLVGSVSATARRRTLLRRKEKPGNRGQMGC